MVEYITQILTLYLNLIAINYTKGTEYSLKRILNNIYLQPDGVNLFKLLILLDQIFYVLNIEGGEISVPFLFKKLRVLKMFRNPVMKNDPCVKKIIDQANLISRK